MVPKKVSKYQGIIINIRSSVDSKEDVKKLINTDFIDVFNENLSDYIQKKITEYDFNYYDVTTLERDQWIKKIIDIIYFSTLEKAGKNRLEKWEEGWKENLDKFVSGSKVNDITPLYFGKYNVIRWKQRFIKPVNENFENNSLAIIQDWLFDKYMRNASNIYEFGCGTGHNLFRVRSVNSDARIWGLDWSLSSQKIIQKIAHEGIDQNIFPHYFDFFNPDYNFILEENAIVFTSAAIEQVGTHYKKFIKYLLKQNISLCIHIEPIVELLDENNLLDYLSIQYIKKREYLFGYLDYLRQLEKKREIKIHNAQRMYIGSLFLEGYSVIVWSPIK